MIKISYILSIIAFLIAMYNWYYSIKITKKIKKEADEINLKLQELSVKLVFIAFKFLNEEIENERRKNIKNREKYETIKEN